MENLNQLPLYVNLQADLSKTSLNTNQLFQKSLFWQLNTKLGDYSEEIDIEYLLGIESFYKQKQQIYVHKISNLSYENQKLKEQMKSITQQLKGNKKLIEQYTQMIQKLMRENAEMDKDQKRIYQQKMNKIKLEKLKTIQQQLLFQKILNKQYKQKIDSLIQSAKQDAYKQNKACQTLQILQFGNKSENIRKLYQAKTIMLEKKNVLLIQHFNKLIQKTQQQYRLVKQQVYKQLLSFNQYINQFIK